MKTLTIFFIAVLTIAISGFLTESGNNSSFIIAGNNVAIREDITGGYNIVLAVETANMGNESLYLKSSDFDIVDEEGNLICTMNAVKAYPSTVSLGEIGVFYAAKVSDKISDSDMKLSAIPHIEVEVSKLTDNQRKELVVTGASIEGSSYAYAWIKNISSKTEYNDVYVATIGRTEDNEVVSVMTATIDEIKPREEVKVLVKDQLEQSRIGPENATTYQHFVYIEP